MGRIKRNMAQSTLEYAVIVTVVIVSLLALQIYIKRAAEGKLRESSDRLGQQFEIGNTITHSENTRNGTVLQLTNVDDTGTNTSDTKGVSQTVITGEGEISTSLGNETVNPGNTTTQ